jgi:hypothetical protein
LASALGHLIQIHQQGLLREHPRCIYSGRICLNKTIHKCPRNQTTGITVRLRQAIILESRIAQAAGSWYLPNLLNN